MLRLDLLVNSFVHSLARGETLEVYEPEARRSFVHVSDAARAFLFALDNTPRLAGRLFNVGDEDRRDYAVSFARFCGEGFRAIITLEQGIEELARS